MATLANIFDRFTMTRPLGETRGAAIAEDHPCLVRPIPNDDIFFYVKRFDNSGVVRMADPAESRACWRVLGMSAGAVALAICILLPSLQGLMAGFELEGLRAGQRQLIEEGARLDLEKSKLDSPRRLAGLALQGDFVAPSPQRVVWLEDTENRLARR